MTDDQPKPEPEGTASFLSDALEGAETVFVKKLSRNDSDWADLTGKHQNGPYIPPNARDGGFFPLVQSMVRPGGSEIREAIFKTVWPQTGEEKATRLVHYTSKGEETHLTGVPKDLFRDLSPGSYLVITKRGTAYQCFTIDSNSASADWLEQVLDLEADFRLAVIDANQFRARVRDAFADFIAEAVSAFTAGKLAELVRAHSRLPDPLDMAQRGRHRYMDRTGTADLSPFALDRPGDVIREISRSDELAIYKDLELRSRSLQLATIVLGDGKDDMSPQQVIERMVRQFPQIDAAMLSASQTRRNRAGSSFEHHVERLMMDGGVPYGRQVVTGGRRPDFVLPCAGALSPESATEKLPLIVALKTTLRERWKQVQYEKKLADVPLFLATVDDSVSANAIREMKDLGITLVVPESLKAEPKKRRISEYRDHENVIDFRTFFDREIREKRLDLWKSLCPAGGKTLPT